MSNQPDRIYPGETIICRFDGEDEFVTVEQYHELLAQGCKIEAIWLEEPVICPRRKTFASKVGQPFTLLQ